MGAKAVADGEKSARRRGALTVFEDESEFSLLPAVRATWAPRGKTPVLRHRFSWKRLFMAGALAYEPDGSDAQLIFQMRPGAYNDQSLIEFLTEMHALPNLNVDHLVDTGCRCTLTGCRPARHGQGPA